MAPRGPADLPGVLVRVDPRTDAVAAIVPLTNGALYGAVAGGVFWLAVGQQLVRFDPVTLQSAMVPGALANQVPCGKIAADERAVWIAGGVCGVPRLSLARVDAAGLTVTGQLQLQQVVDVAIGLGAVWAVTSAGTLVRVDETTGKATGSMTTGLGRQTVLHAGAGALWLAGSTGELERFAPR